MSSTREQIPPRRKRQRTEAGSLDGPSESRPSKRQKPSINLHSAEFYDSLSKVWLTRRALKELDRRTSQANSPQRPPTPRRVTRNISNKIQIFARDGGPELRDLRGYPAPKNDKRTMSSSRSSKSRQTKSTAPTSASSKTKRSSAYDKDFEQHLIDYHIYTEGYDYNSREAPEPDNLEELYQRLGQPRQSLSPSRFTASDFKSFKQKNARVIDEGDVMRDVVPIIAGNSDIQSRQNLLFSRLCPIANNTTVDARPDFYDGARLGDIDKQVQQDLGSYIIPTGHIMAPVAPNFFLEAKRPSGGADVVKRQACYDGAIGARAMHQLQSYKQDKPVYDGNAYTITSTYHDGHLRMYTTHPSQAEDGTTEYHMTQTKTFTLTDDPDTCRQGLTRFRNGRDYTQEQRDAFISAANERARSVNAEPPPFESSDYINLSDPTVEDAGYLTTEDDPVDDPQYYMSQPQEGHLGSEQPTFESSYDDDLSNEDAGHIYPESSTFDSFNYNSHSDVYPIPESETSADELALDTYAQPKSSNKRRNKASDKTVSKAPRRSGGSSSGRRHSKRQI